MQKKFGRPVTITGRANILKDRDIIENDGRYTIRYNRKLEIKYGYINTVEDLLLP